MELRNFQCVSLCINFLALTYSATAIFLAHSIPEKEFYWQDGWKIFPFVLSLTFVWAFSLSHLTMSQFDLVAFLQDQPGFLSMVVCLALISMSFGSVWTLHQFLDDTSPLALSLTYWKQEWLIPVIEDLKKVKKPSDYRKINDEARTVIGVSLLEYSVSTGRLHLTKVGLHCSR